MASVNPYSIVDTFERAVAEYCGAPYGVAVESGTAAIFLSLQWIKYNYNPRPIGEITIPSRTYPSVPCSIIHCGGKVKFSDEPWEGEYRLDPYDIWDSALRFKRKMYRGGLQCLSFHVKKNLPIGRGGMILTWNEECYKWLKKARFDGREPKPLQEDNFTMLGWNCYLQPDQAARGLQILQTIGDRDLPDLDVSQQGYPDLSKFDIYKQ